MKIIRARIRNGRLTDPVDRRDLDREIGEGNETCDAIVVVIAREDRPKLPSLDVIEQAIVDCVDGRGIIVEMHGLAIVRGAARDGNGWP
jgi:hypothetical protein